MLLLQSLIEFLFSGGQNCGSVESVHPKLWHYQPERLLGLFKWQILQEVRLSAQFKCQKTGDVSFAAVHCACHTELKKWQGCGVFWEVYSRATDSSRVERMVW